MRRDGKMTEESKGMNPRTWNAIAVGMLFPMSVFQLFRRARTIAACQESKKM